jgi:hypothetical protein
MDQIWKVVAIPPFLRTPLVPVGTPIAELSATPARFLVGLRSRASGSLSQTHRKADWFSTLLTVYATLTHPTAYGRSGHTVQRNHSAKQYNALAESAQRGGEAISSFGLFMPITIQTCAPPHVYPPGKHAPFHKTDAQVGIGAGITGVIRGMGILPMLLARRAGGPSPVMHE